MPRKPYRETFDDGPGGWLGWCAGGQGARRLHLRDGVATVWSPWGVDTNHAPPGAGYLHLLYALPLADFGLASMGGANRFLDEGCSHDLTNARMTLTMRGELNARGAQLLLLIQANVGDVRTNDVLIAQPIAVEPEWRDTELLLAPDQDQWLNMGTRGPGADYDRYGQAPISQALQHVDVDLILVLFPLDVQPREAHLVPAGDRDRLLAGAEYEVDHDRLPSGFVQLSEVRIDYPD